MPHAAGSNTWFISGSGHLLLTLPHAVPRATGAGLADWTRPNTTSPAWSKEVTFGTTASDHLDFPRGVAVTPDVQTAVVSDAGNDRMSVWALTCTD